MGSKQPPPIGIFDSGVGGLTVVSAVRKAMPEQNIVYLGDTARVPYGTKSAHTIRRYTEEVFTFLETKNVNELVIACNSASSAFHAKFWNNVPVSNVIDPAVAALIQIQKKVKRPLRVLLLGTRATVQSGEYERRLASALGGSIKDFQVYAQACPLFVPLVEENVLKQNFTRQVIHHYLESYKTKEIDVVILGCTHYPLLKAQIADYLGRQIKILSSGDLLAPELAAKLGASKRSKKGSLEIWVTDPSDAFNRLAKIILKEDVRPKIFELK